MIAAGLRRGRVGTFAKDSFTDTSGLSLPSHTGERATWTRTAGTANAVISNANRVWAPEWNETIYQADQVPPSADYNVSGDLYVASYNALYITGVYGRYNSATGVYYFGHWYNGQWRISSNTGQLGATAQAVSAGSTYSYRLELRGTTQKLYVNNVLLVSTADTSVTAAGRVAFSCNSACSNTTGFHFDNFLAVGT